MKDIFRDNWVYFSLWGTLLWFLALSRLLKKADITGCGFFGVWGQSQGIWQFMLSGVILSTIIPAVCYSRPTWMSYVIHSTCSHVYIFWSVISYFADIQVLIMTFWLFDNEIYIFWYKSVNLKLSLFVSQSNCVAGDGSNMFSWWHSGIAVLHVHPKFSYFGNEQHRHGRKASCALTKVKTNIDGNLC
jgi:hypothetical protein